MSIVSCPNCKSVLNPFEKMFKCKNGHSFDLSKAGYINLLLPNKKKTLNPGDNKLMMNAREAFLSSGHYDFLIECIASSIKSSPSFSEKSTLAHLLDLGCGSGYYTRHLLADSSLKKVGIDISKIGITTASKKDKTATYIVSSVFDLPIADNSVEFVLNIFSPCSLNEVARVLKPEGYFLKVVPANVHMKEVAALIYEFVKPHQTTIETDIAAHADLQIVETKKLEKKVMVSDSDLLNLISMTPYFYKFEKVELEKLTALEVTFSFNVIIAKYT